MSAADTTAPPITPFEFQREHDGSLSLETAVYQALGRASTCWESMEGTGVFDDAAARGVGQALLAHIAATAPKPTAIRVYRTSNNGGWSWCFEADNTAVVHNMDSPVVFPYKPPQMRKIFAAFSAMLSRHARAGEGIAR